MKIKLERDPNVHMVNIHFIRIYIICTFVYRYVYINESLMYGCPCMYIKDKGMSVIFTLAFLDLD